MSLSAAGVINNSVSMNGFGAIADRSGNQNQGTGQNANAFNGANTVNEQLQNNVLAQMPTAANFSNTAATTSIVGASPAGSALGNPFPTTLTIPTLNFSGFSPAAPASAVPAGRPASSVFSAIPSFSAFGFSLPQPNFGLAQQLVSPQSSLLSVPEVNLEPEPPEEEEALSLSPETPSLELPQISSAPTQRNLFLPALPALPVINLSPQNSASLLNLPRIGLPTPQLNTNTAASALRLPPPIALPAARGLPGGENGGNAANSGNQSTSNTEGTSVGNVISVMA